MKSEKILVLLDSKNNENLLNLSVSLAKNDKSTLYFMYVVEVPCLPYSKCPPIGFFLPLDCVFLSSFIDLKIIVEALTTGGFTD